MCLCNLYLQCIYMNSLTIPFLKFMHASSTFVMAYTFRIFQFKVWPNSLFIILLYRTLTHECQLFDTYSPFYLSTIIQLLHTQSTGIFWQLLQLIPNYSFWNLRWIKWRSECRWIPGIRELKPAIELKQFPEYIGPLNIALRRVC